MGLTSLSFAEAESTSVKSARDLRNAVAQNNLPSVIKLLTDGADPSLAGNDFESAQSLAETRNLVVIHALLAHKSSVRPFVQKQRKVQAALEKSFCPKSDEKVGRKVDFSKRTEYVKDPSEVTIRLHGKAMSKLGATQEELQKNWKDAIVQDWVIPVRQGAARITTANLEYERGEIIYGCRSGFLITRTGLAPGVTGIDGNFSLEALDGYCQGRMKGPPNHHNGYKVRPFAHGDLDADGRDEIIVEMSGDHGGSFIIFSEYPKNGNWTAIASGCEWGD